LTRVQAAQTGRVTAALAKLDADPTNPTARRLRSTGMSALVEQRRAPG
jgi:hypothetical protein